jgi:general secretion pathway protein M
MREWLEKLEPRERLVLAVGAAVSLVLVLYAGLWYPVQSQIERLERSVAEQSATVEWMKVAAREVEQLRSSSVARRAGDGGPLLTLVEQSARRAGLGTALSRVEPQGATQVRVWLEAAPFDAMIGWLGQVRESQGVEVESVVLDPQQEPGLVNARLVLQRGGPT